MTYIYNQGAAYCGAQAFFGNGNLGQGTPVRFPLEQSELLVMGLQQGYKRIHTGVTAGQPREEPAVDEELPTVGPICKIEWLPLHLKRVRGT
jgi:hypothetical protein